MRNSFNFSPTAKSKIDSLDFDNIPFGRVFSDHMFMVDYIDGEWVNAEICPLAPLSIHPGNLAWHYGQSIFEGMKATKDKEGNPKLFRPEMHIERLNRSAGRMCMPELPQKMFLDAVHQLVDIEKDWIPPTKGSSLYLRPLMIAMDEAIGVRASSTYKFMIMALPVGPYYNKPVSLKTPSMYVRAVAGGVGEAKTAGNYAASLYPAKLANEMGFDQIMWLDAKEYKYIQEVGTMNIFFVINGKVMTPEADGAILKGITRDTALHLLRDEGYDVEVRRITIDEVVEAYKRGELDEVFGTGTAAVASFVHKIEHGDFMMDLSASENKVGKYVKEFLDGVRAGEIEDKYGWVVSVESSVPV